MRQAREPFGEAGLGDDQDGFAVLGDVGVAVGGESGVGEHRHRAEAGRGEEGDDPGDAVGQGDQNAASLADAVPGEYGGGAGGEAVHLSVRDGPVSLVIGDPVRPPAPERFLSESCGHVHSV
ncbi:hypothetical protein GCM10020254_01800 [Streptomyces goshikiensis]